MIFKKDDVEEKILPEFFGGEKELRARLYVGELGKILTSAVLSAGASIGEHTHTDSSEIIYIISGCGTASDDGTEYEVQAGDVIYCPKRHSHGLRNTGKEDIVFFAAVPKQ